MAIRLTTANVLTLKDGRHRDTQAHNLHLVVRTKGTSRSFMWRYGFQGKTLWITLGSLKRADGRGDLSLDDARKKATEKQAILNTGADPKTTNAVNGAVKLATFREDVLAYHKQKASGDRWSPAWASLWLGSMTVNIFPEIGDRATSSLTSDDIKKALDTIWQTKNQTARWIAGAIANVIAKAMFARKAEFAGKANPALGVVKYMMDEVKVTVVNHPSIPWAAAPSLYGTLAAMDIKKHRNSRAAMLVMLTGSRAAEIIGLKYGEISGDVAAIPGCRMKSGRDHLIPLSGEAMRIVDELRGDSQPDPDSFVFTGRRGKTVNGQFIEFSGKAHKDSMQILLREELELPWHVHGMRSTWRTYVSDHAPSHTMDRACEIALDHKVAGESNVRGVYDRANLLKERRELAEQWARFLTGA